MPHIVATKDYLRIQSKPASQIDLDPKTDAALIMKDDYMFLSGNKDNGNTITLGGIYLMPKLNPALAKIVMNWISENQDEIYRELHSIQAFQT